LPEFAFAFIDCEFGGLDPELHDITEIAIILTDYRLVELGAREWKVQARADRITKEAAEISGYTPEAWTDALPLRRVLGEIGEMLPRGHTVVPAGQNVRMDVQFLERAYRSCSLPFPFDYHVIDLATLFYAWSLVAGETLRRSAAPGATVAGLIEGSGAPRWPTRVSRWRPSATSSAASAARGPSEAPRGARRRRVVGGRRRHFRTAPAVREPGSGARAPRESPAELTAIRSRSGPAPCPARAHVAAVSQIEMHDAARVELRTPPPAGFIPREVHGRRREKRTPPRCSTAKASASMRPSSRGTAGWASRRR
jgi:oligoribonuclease (3'-5' exoribonuclease)